MFYKDDLDVGLDLDSKECFLSEFVKNKDKSDKTMATVITMYNEGFDELKFTLSGVFRNYY